MNSCQRFEIFELIVITNPFVKYCANGKDWNFKTYKSIETANSIANLKKKTGPLNGTNTIKD